MDVEQLLREGVGSLHCVLFTCPGHAHYEVVDTGISQSSLGKLRKRNDNFKVTSIYNGWSEYGQQVMLVIGIWAESPVWPGPSISTTATLSRVMTSELNRVRKGLADIFRSVCSIASPWWSVLVRALCCDKIP